MMSFGRFRGRGRQGEARFTAMREDAAGIYIISISITRYLL